MPTVRQFEDLNVWQDARQPVKAVYAASKVRAFNQDFGLREPIRRAAVTVMANIAEGFERGTRNEFVPSLNLAKGSNGEVCPPLGVAPDQKYMGETEFNSPGDLSVTWSKKLSACIRCLEGDAANSRGRKPAHAAANPQPA